MLPETLKKLKENQRVPGLEHAPGTKNLVPSPWYQVLGTKYLVPGVEPRVTWKLSVLLNQGVGICTWNLSWNRGVIRACQEKLTPRVIIMECRVGNHIFKVYGHMAQDIWRP